MRHITDDERRARLARRHGIAPAYRLPDPVLATRAMTVLHATEPPSVYLSLLARVDDITVDDVDRALYRDRTLVKQLAMRRTVFIFTRDLLPAAWGSASARVAVQNRARLVKEVEAAGITADGELWLKEAAVAVVARLDGRAAAVGRPAARAGARTGRHVSRLAGQEVRRDVPDRPAGAGPAGGRATHHAGRERRSLAHIPTDLDGPGALARRGPDPLSEQAGYAELVRRWLPPSAPAPPPTSSGGSAAR